jgi:four helix bundle protein
MDAAMRVFELTKRFPVEEKYSLTDQFRRASRSVAANIAEAWRKRRYPAAFVNKLNDAEGEAAECQTWIELAFRCKYLSEADAVELDGLFDQVLAQLVCMIEQPDDWTVGAKRSPRVSTSQRPRVTSAEESQS